MTHDKRFDKDAPEWIAYVLGELDPETNAAIEQILAENQEARDHVAELRQTTDLLFAELAAEPAPALTDIDRARIARAAGDDSASSAGEARHSSSDAASEAAPEAPAKVIDIRARRWPRALVIGGGLAAAAALIAVVMLPADRQYMSQATSDNLDVQHSRVSQFRAISESLDPSGETARSADSPVISSGAGNGGKSDSWKNSGADRSGYYGAGSGRRNSSNAATDNGGAESTLRLLQPGYAGEGQNGPVSSSTQTVAGLTTTPTVPPGAHRVVIEGIDDKSKAGQEGERSGLVETEQNKDLPNTEAYDRVIDNQFLSAREKPLSTFSIDVDTASYANARRYLQRGARPPKDAVRIEEMINYFSYDYRPPSSGDAPFAFHVDTSVAPWNRQNRLVRIGIKGKEIARTERPRGNLVFLLDVSGSMEDPNKLPLLRRSLSMLVNELEPDDRIAIAVYAGASGLVLPSTPVSKKAKILSSLERLKAGGSTNGGAGIELAYAVAARHFIEGGVNRVILATDGDFNVGTTSRGELTRLIEDKAKSGVFLTVLGFGMGNYKDAMLEELSGKGNGTYAYIDTIHEARKVLAKEAMSTLVTIAKDVKIQLEFNPTRVSRYRLIGYENRILAARDFADDQKDAGEIGAGHTVTALYEVVPVPAAGPGETPSPADSGSIELKYQTSKPSDAAYGDDLFTIKLRYKEPQGSTSKLLERAVKDRVTPWDRVSNDFSFAASVAAFGMILRDSEHRGNASLGLVLDLATRGRGRDPHGYRGEFIDLVERAKRLP